MGGRFLYNRKQFRPFGCGTAHRPFPTVSLKRSTFAPAVCIMFDAVPHFPHQARPRASQLPPREAFCVSADSPVVCVMFYAPLVSLVQGIFAVKNVQAAAGAMAAAAL